MKKEYSSIKNWGHKELFTIFLDTLQTIWYVDEKRVPNILDVIEKLSKTAYPIQKLNSLLEELNETEHELVGLEKHYINRDKLFKNIALATINSSFNFLFV